MKLFNLRTNFLLFLSICASGYFTFWYFSEHKEYSFIVKIPKEFNQNFSDEELLRYYQDGNYIPISELKNEIYRLLQTVES